MERRKAESMDGHAPGEEESREHGLHIVIFPWLAFGHLLSCLDLTDRLASRGHRVSFVSTPRNISRLPPLRRAVAPLVDMVTLQLPRVDGLPDGAESTRDVAPGRMKELLLMAFQGLAAPFSKFMDAACGSSNKMRKPDWVIIDTFHHWAVPAAAKHEVPCAGLLLCAASMAALMLPTNFDTAGEDHHRSGALKRCAMTLQGCQLVVVRSCLELEPDSVAAVVARSGGKPVVTLGLLLPEGRSSSEEDEDGGVRRWLDAQPAKSVVYVALGTEAPLRAEHVREMALGLELAGTRFLWALKKPHPHGHGNTDADVLPPGFEERTHGRGLVAMGWVSQLSVLAHGSVAAFLTHCGWSSTVEGLLFGRPLIMLPMAADQWSNARIMEGRQVGVQVARHGEDGSFGREGVAAAVRVITTDPDCGVFRANAKKLQKMVADREGHERCIDDFIHHLKSLTCMG